MKAVIKLLDLQTKGIARAFVYSIDDKPIERHFNLRFSMNAYNDLLKHFKDNILVNLGQGQIVRYIESVDIDPKKAVVVDESSIINAILSDKPMKKKEYYKQYCDLTNTSLRTAIARLQKAILNGVIDEVDYYTVKRSVQQ